MKMKGQKQIYRIAESFNSMLANGTEFTKKMCLEFFPEAPKTIIEVFFAAAQRDGAVTKIPLGHFTQWRKEKDIDPVVAQEYLHKFYTNKKKVSGSRPIETPADGEEKFELIKSSDLRMIEEKFKTLMDYNIELRRNQAQLLDQIRDLEAELRTRPKVGMADLSRIEKVLQM